MNGVDFKGTVSDEGSLDPAILQDNMGKLMNNAIRGMLVATDKMVSAQMEKAITEAVGRATGTVNADMAVKEMQRMLPFTSNPIYEPVAKATLTGFLRQGQDMSLAIENVGKYFQAMAGDMAKHYKLNVPERPGMVPPAQQFGPAEPEAPSQDWLSVFTGGSSTE
ncbi:MAG: hypothetical protein ACR2O4_06475 [Hyphomicrobiaceae bacterium]